MEVEMLQRWCHNVMKMCFTWVCSSSCVTCVGALDKGEEFMGLF